MTTKENHQDLLALMDYLKRNRGFDFSGYKMPSLSRRFQKRMEMLGIHTYGDYIDYLEVHPEEFVELFNTVLINVTAFFRDASAWEYLEKGIIPRLLANKKHGESIRVWSTGCASGEEAYSLAMLLAEALGENAFREQVKIYATDVDEEALNKARMGIYTHKDADGIPQHLLDKYFTRSNNTYSFLRELRRNLIFGRNDLLQDAPISRIDLLTCRNTLMYFNAEAQAKILARFHFALNDDGYLFLGKAEMLITHTNTFKPVDLKLRIFAKVPKVNLRDRLLLMAHSGNEEGMNNLISLVRVRDASFNAGPLAQLIVDVNNVLIQANEPARSLFALSAKDLGRPFQDLQVSYYPLELRTSMQLANAERSPVVKKEIIWPSRAGEPSYYDIHIQPLVDNGSTLLGTMITFIEVTQYKLLQQQHEQTNQELETAMEELQSTNEELETTNEELQSTVEELETTNEELQSTNEELETMNEELQSTNEELQTINDELHQRTDDLNETNAFMEAVLTSVQSGVVVLSKELSVQVWNRKMEDLWGLREDEVQSRNFLSLDIGLPVEKLRRPVLACLSGETGYQVTVVEALNRRGRSIQCRVICSPLLARDHQIQGVIALVDEDHSENG